MRQLTFCPFTSPVSAADVRKLSGSRALLGVATIRQVLVERSNDERRQCKQYQSAGTIAGRAREGTSSGSHRMMLQPRGWDRFEAPVFLRVFAGRTRFFERCSPPTGPKGCRAVEVDASRS
jgi:hypothetical protein